MNWIALRLVVAVGLVWVVASLVFLSLHLVPGDPALSLLTQGSSAPSPEAVDALRHELGLDRPLWQQYIDSLSGVLRGDLGQSMQDGSDVLEQVAERLPRTLELIGAAALLSLAAGIPLGFLAARHQGSLFDRAVVSLAGIAQSIPVFVIGTVFIYLFAQKLRWVPAGGYVAPSEDLGRHLLLLFLPAFAISFELAANVIRITRSSVLDVARQNYVRTAFAKGLRDWQVQRGHVLRNAVSPIMTVLALNLGSLLGGTVLVEYVFNWPGLSGLLVEAVNARDYVMVVGVILTISTFFVLLNLLVDIGYGLLDPRVRR